jgi:hypothetical protein
MNMVRVRRLVLALIILLVVAQLVQPKRTNPPVIPSRSLEAHVQVPGRVQFVLRRACGDCHSNQTVWPWYSHVAPISWLITSDVNQGRHHIDFDDWEAQESPNEATEHLALICKEVRDRAMPPISYRMMHKQSRLSPEELDVVCAWSQSFGSKFESRMQGHQ